MTHDLIVVGGGPAGCAAALTAARAGANVVLLERGRYPRHKVCGEFISPESLMVLSSLLQADDRARLLVSSPKIAAMRIFVDGRTIKAPIKPHAISVSRYDLDLALWRACEAAGVDARQNVVVENVPDAHTVVASGARFSAQAVVDATGRWSNLRCDRVVKTSSQFVGLKAHFAENGAPLSADLYFFSGGYCGVQPIADGTVNVCAMVRADLASKLVDVFSLEQRPAERAKRWTALTDPVSTFPLMFREPVPVNDGVFHAGDAAGFIDPFVGDGISLALQTGVAAADALRSVWRDGECLEGATETYRAEYNRRFRPVFRRAAQVRWLFALPLPLRAVAATVAQVPGVSSRILKLTRAG